MPSDQFDIIYQKYNPLSGRIITARCNFQFQKMFLHVTLYALINNVENKKKTILLLQQIIGKHYF